MDYKIIFCIVAFYMIVSIIYAIWQAARINKLLYITRELIKNVDLTNARVSANSDMLTIIGDYCNDNTEALLKLVETEGKVSEVIRLLVDRLTTKPEPKVVDIPVQATIQSPIGISAGSTSARTRSRKK